MQLIVLSTTDDVSAHQITHVKIFYKCLPLNFLLGFLIQL